MDLKHSRLSSMPSILVSEDNLVNKYVVDDDGYSRLRHSAADEQNFNSSFMSRLWSDLYDLYCKIAKLLHVLSEYSVSSDNSLESHNGFTVALRYLGVKDLLSVGTTCRSLYSDVCDSPLFWTNLYIDRPLNERITDGILLLLASRAKGDLQCLNLVACPKITDDGLREILKMNRRITKLCVPGCTRISIECIVNSIKEYNSDRGIGRGIKKLRIGGISNISQEAFDDLKVLLGIDESSKKPPIYHRGNFYLPNDDDRALDIEKCPRCNQRRLVYDCPAKDCNMSDQVSCRACCLCIPRCARCGRCIDKREHIETFCLQLQCWNC